MARKEDKQPQYLPLIVKAKLHTGGRDYEKIKEELKGQGFTCKQMKGMVREGSRQARAADTVESSFDGGIGHGKR